MPPGHRAEGKQYALRVTTGGGSFGALNLALLLAAAFGLGLFVRAERRASTPRYK